MIYLTVDELLRIAVRVIDGEVIVRDLGLLAAAAARPEATYQNELLYPTIQDQSAALLHSIARDHALIDGNKRLALAATVVFLGINGHRLVASNDEAYELVADVASGELNDMSAIAARLAPLIRSR